MADSIILSDGTSDYEFVYDATTQNDFKVYYGVRAEAGEPDPLWHRPDSAPPKLIRLKNQPRTIFLTQNVYGDDWDDVLNTLAPIKRLVDGEDQQAGRYHTHGDVNKVYLRIQLDGMTNYTDATVIYGDVDDSGSFYTPAAILNKRALGVVLMLVVEPLGEGAPITLRNDLPHSPGNLEDSSGDGLSNMWNTFLNGTPTTSISTTRYITGGKSQRIDVDASTTEGIRSKTVTATAGSNIVAYVWVHAPTAEDSLTISLEDASSVTIGSVAVFTPGNPGGYDKYYPQPAGYAWYRYSFTGTNTNADCRLHLRRTSALATKASAYFIDNAYIEVGQTVVPDAWASASRIKNRNDPGGAGKEDDINFLDVWGVPGDSDAVTNILLAPTLSGTGRFTVLTQSADGKQLAASRKYTYEAESMTKTDNPAVAFWTTVASGTSSGGNHERITASVNTAFAWIYQDLSSVNSGYFVSKNRRVYALARSSNAATTIELDDATSFQIGSYLTEPASFTSANTWELLDLGALNHEMSAAVNYQQATSFRFTVRLPTSGNTCDIDCFFFLPFDGDGGYLVFDSDNQTAMYIDGRIQAVERSDRPSGSYGGGIWGLQPGNKMTRYILLHSHGSAAYDLTDPTTVTLTIYPRTRHLLGTS